MRTRCSGKKRQIHLKNNFECCLQILLGGSFFLKLKVLTFTIVKCQKSCFKSTFNYCIHNSALKHNQQRHWKQLKSVFPRYNRMQMLQCMFLLQILCKTPKGLGWHGEVQPGVVRQLQRPGPSPSAWAGVQHWELDEEDRWKGTFHKGIL